MMMPLCDLKFITEINFFSVFVISPPLHLEVLRAINIPSLLLIINQQSHENFPSAFNHLKLDIVKKLYRILYPEKWINASMRKKDDEGGIKKTKLLSLSMWTIKILLHKHFSLVRGDFFVSLAMHVECKILISRTVVWWSWGRRIFSDNANLITYVLSGFIPRPSSLSSCSLYV